MPTAPDVAQVECTWHTYAKGASTRWPGVRYKYNIHVLVLMPCGSPAAGIKISMA